MKKVTKRAKLLPRRAPENRKQSILDAASEVFAGRDYEDVSVSEIVKQAGVAQGTFYLYFPNKQAILTALAESLLAELEGHLERVAAEQSTTIDFLSAIQAVAMRTMRRFRAVLPLLDAEKIFFVCDPNAGEPKIHLLATLENFIRRDQANGNARSSISPVIAARLIVSGLHRFAVDCVFLDAQFSEKTYTEQMLTFFANALGTEYAAEKVGTKRSASRGSRS